MIDITELRAHSSILDKEPDITIKMHGFEQTQPTVEFIRCTKSRSIVKTKTGFAVVWRDEVDEYAISFDLSKAHMLLISGSGEHFKFKPTDGDMRRVDITGDVSENMSLFFYYTRSGELVRGQ